MTCLQPRTIPPMTDPLGKYWEQPSLDEISFSLIYAWMTPATFEKIKHYQTSYPTGVYAGKMWKLTAIIGRAKQEWLLMYYDIAENFAKLPGLPDMKHRIRYFIIKIQP